MMFLNPIQNGYLIAQELYMKHLPTNCYLFPLETFWDKRKFFTEVKKLSDYMNLEIDLPYDAEIVHDAFINQIKEYQTRDRINRIVQALKNNKHYDISNLDTIEQAYLSAYIEKNNDFITIPLTNKFFKNTQDILAFLKYYPQHYKAMNPSLPTFNNIPNPFFLHNKQKNAKIKQ